MVDQVREIALKVLYEIDQKEAYANIALDEALKQARKTKKSIDSRDIGFISEIVYSTTTWKLTIDEVIKKYSRIRIKKISPWILTILRMSIDQIIFLDKVPKSAVVNEGVNLAKKYGHKASSNFVNAILRKVEKSDYEEFFKIKDPIERISKTTSMPVWLIEELQKNQSIEEVEKICKDCLLKPKLHIRINPLRTNDEELIKELEKQGIEAKPLNIKHFYMLIGAKNIEGIKAFQEGKFTVQDEGAGLIAKILNPQPKQKVLDTCSSPGGKTTYMAEMMNNQGKIIAWDLHEHRIKLVQKTAERLGIKIIQTEIKDATQYEETYKETFDKILLDVPCSGTGVLKRKPDIKWKRKKEDLKEIIETQRQILENGAKYLKVGGELVYSTCSILKDENEEVIDQFLKNNKNFTIQPIDLEKDEFYQKYVKKEQYIHIDPNEKTDGFFICKIIKN